MTPSKRIVHLSLKTLLAGLICLTSIQGVAMAFFSKEKVVLSSPMEGVLTLNGEPAAGAELRRVLEWRGDEITDTTTTDESGQFKLPLVETEWRQMLPVQFVVHQRITARYAGEEYLVWAMGKVDENLYGELGGSPQNFRCELSGELRRVEVEYGLLGTICEWDSINK